jgi:transcriptional regulator with XRE-family HTH domain
MSKLGDELRALREVRKKSLRQVEEETNVSNAYLSQLERGVAENPSPHLLHRLAEYYEAPYEALMVAAGYVKPSAPGKSGKTPSSLEILLKSAKLSQEEEEEVKRYIRYLRSKRS